MTSRFQMRALLVTNLSPESVKAEICPPDKLDDVLKQLAAEGKMD